ncbi:ATP-binding cassette domain-containing protein [Phycicoccus avicenniae]|uniref:ATP-binding cassette domain-containing protein n=1 Tax=Phycicoccus avicenniae TaxID=2828860 RepID=UPI003D2708F2
MSRPSAAVVCTGLVLRVGPGSGHDAGPPLDAAFAPGTATSLPATARTTRLLWTLAGVLTPSGGRITVGDVEVRDPESARVAGVHLVPEDNGLLPSLTARENVLLPGALRADPDAVARTDQVLETLGLTEVGDHLVEELSGGQQQRVAVARALAQDPAVLLAHEPTSALDATTRQLVLGLLVAHARRGRVVVLTTSDPEALGPSDEGDVREGH